MARSRVGLTTAKYRVTVADRLAKGTRPEWRAQGWVSPQPSTERPWLIDWLRGPGLSGVPKGGSHHSQVQSDRG